MYDVVYYKTNKFICEVKLLVNNIFMGINLHECINKTKFCLQFFIYLIFIQLILSHLLLNIFFKVYICTICYN